MIKIDKTGKRPAILVIKGKDKGKDRLLVETEKLKQAYLNDPAAYKTGKKKFNFNSDVYAHNKIKSALIEVQHGKCCFCESRITHVQYGDVEHFRPKAAWKIKKIDKYTRPGYYWLTYDWDNLFFSCQLCNQRYKRNLFPLVDESKRVLDHTCDVNDEEPLFIHPGKIDPEEHITFKGVDVKVKNNSKKGEITIKALNLNRDELLNNREEIYSLIESLIIIYRLIPARMYENEVEKKVRIKEKIKELIAPKHQYLNMIKANFGEDIQKILNDPI